MLLTSIVQNARTNFREVDWSRMLIYTLFLTALGVTFTPTFDQWTREVARYFLYALLGFLIVDRRPRP